MYLQKIILTYMQNKIGLFDKKCDLYQNIVYLI